VNRTLRSRHRWLWIFVVMVLLTGGWYAARSVAPVVPTRPSPQARLGQPALPEHGDGVP
jgi:hypothetical protein